MKKNFPNIFLIFALIGFFNIIYAEELTTINQSLKEDFKTTTTIEKKEFTLTDDQLEKLKNKVGSSIYSEYDKTIPIYLIKKDQQTIGYALEHTVKGKWGPIHYLLVVSPQGKILNIHILSYEEKRGQPIAKPRFISQFIAKSINNSIRLKKDIQGITGATISSRGITDGVRKLLTVFEEFRKL